MEIGTDKQDAMMLGHPVSISRRSSSDNVPLLLNSEVCTEMHELRQETISMISS